MACMLAQKTVRSSVPMEASEVTFVCRAEHTVAITPDDVITWGSNSMGQCGQGDRAETDWVKPRSIKPLQSMFVCQIVCGRYHTLCVTATSQVLCSSDPPTRIESILVGVMRPIRSFLCLDSCPSSGGHAMAQVQCRGMGALVPKLLLIPPPHPTNNLHMSA